MKPSTVRTLLAICVVLDLALLGLVLYDYFVNDSDWIAYVLIAFAVFVVITAILFLLAGRLGDRTVVHEHHHETTHEFQPVTGIAPAIPPAPARTVYVAPVAPAKPAYLAKVERVADGPFVYNGYTLHSRTVKLANAGGSRTIYFFSKKKPKSGKPCAKPAGYHVGVNERTGLPFLKKGSGKDGEDLTPEQEKGYRPQCSALTEDGKQCRNSAREGSKYCAPHFGYQPPALAKASAAKKDTKARVKGAPDTLPSTRKSWFGRRKANA